jgi:6,7-dimethyl-8-ribityllumazine synthase
MAETLEGKLDASGLKIAVVVARFNSFITERLLEGAIDAFVRTGGTRDDMQLVRVPGSWEMPVVAAELARQKRYDAIVCLGAVIRGETPHFDYVAGNSASGLAHVAPETGVPISFGVLTTNTVEQAIDRAGAKGGNKGFDAVMTAIEMANLLKAIRSTAT